MTRIARLALSTSALALFAGASSAQELTPFAFATNWVAQAEHGGFYQSMVDGTYAECGLDVTIVPGGPQVNGRAMMLAGRVDAYMGGNMLYPFNALVQDIPLIVVASSFQKEPQVLMTHPGKAESFEDLKDLTLFIGEGGYQTYFKWMVSEFGFDESKRRPYTFNSAPFLADEDSAQQGYVTSEPFAIAREGGFEPTIFLLADYGFDTYSTTIEMTKPFVAANPEAVACFVDGTAKGWVNFLYGDNEAAVAKIMEDNPDMTPEQVAFSIETLIKYGIVDSGDSLEMGIGAMTHERMTSFYQKMVAAGVVEAGLDISQTYKLDFVNKGVGLEEKAALGVQ